MTALRLAAALLLALAVRPAAAQLSNHAIGVESGVSAPLRGGGGAVATVALSASTWLTGELEGYARIARASAGGTADRPAAAGWAGALGLRLSLGDDAVRPRVFADVGWTRGGEEDGARVQVRAGAALEVFVAPELSLTAAAALRGLAGAASGEALLALAAYF